MTSKYILIAVLILAAFLRIYNLSNLPPALNWDEVSLGYNAYSVLKTGKDEWGQFLPLSFKAFGEYKLPLYVYLDVPFVAILGLNEWAVRMPSAIIGIFTVIFIYLILKELVKNRFLSLFGFLLAVTTPWLIILSRIALEANFALVLTCAAAYFALKRQYSLILSSIFLGLSVFAYNSSRVVSPLLFVGVMAMHIRQFKSKRLHFILAAVVFIAFFSLAAPLALLQDSSARYKWTAILDQGAINRINELRGQNLYPPAVNNLVFNKVTYFSFVAVSNYLSNFNPNFLFINGGSNYQFSVPGSPLLYPYLLPLLLVGLWVVIKQSDKRWMFLLAWLFIAPIPAAITRDSPHALRSLMIIPPLIIISTLGAGYLLLVKKFTNVLKVSFIFLTLFFLVIFLQNYTVNYPRDYSWSWQYGYKQAIYFINENEDKYSKVYLSKKYGEPHMFLLFYKMVEPNRYIQDPNLVRYFQSDWIWVDSFGKYYFINDWEIKEKAVCQDGQKCLLVTSPGNYPAGSKMLDTVRFLNGDGAFEILEL